MDPLTMLPRLRPVLALALGALSSVATAQTTPDPFEAGLRWRAPADPLEPWIPRDVVLAGRGLGPVGSGEDAFVWVGRAVQTPSVALLSADELHAATEAPQPVYESAALTGALGPVVVAAGGPLDRLFAAHQVADPTAASRRTEVAAHDARGGVRWTHVFAARVNGPVRLCAARDADVVAAAIFDSANARVEVVLLAGDDGSVVASVDVPATALSALALAPDGSRLALASGLDTLVLDGATLTELARVPTPTSTSALALSHDGATLAVGRAAGLDVLRDDGAGYAILAAIPAAPLELPIRAALSDDGELVAVGWWDSSGSGTVRCDALATSGGALLATYTQTGGTLQNYPSSLAATPDGRRVALGLWGKGDAEPEVVLLATDAGSPTSAVWAAWDLAGSVEALALSRDGTRIAVAAKDAHANVFSTTGEVLLFDTGERDLQALTSARRGDVFEAALALREPGAAVFAFGLARATPQPSSVGDLWVNFSAPHTFLTVAGSASATTSLTVPNDPALLTLALAVQAVELTATSVRLGRNVLLPVVF